MKLNFSKMFLIVIVLFKGYYTESKAADANFVYGIEFDDLYVVWLNHPEASSGDFTDSKGVLKASSIYGTYNVKSKNIKEFVDICSSKDSYRDSCVEITTNIFLVVGFLKQKPVFVLIPDFGGYNFVFSHRTNNLPSWSKKGISRLLLWSMKVITGNTIVKSFQTNNIKVPCLK